MAMGDYTRCGARVLGLVLGALDYELVVRFFSCTIPINDQHSCVLIVIVLVADGLPCYSSRVVHASPTYVASLQNRSSCLLKANRSR